MNQARVPPSRCSPPLRTGRDGRLPGRARRLRSAAALGATRPRQRLLLPAPRSNIVEGSGSLPEGGGTAHPDVPRGGGALPGRQAVHQQRGRAGQGHHAWEQRRRPAEVLLPVEAVHRETGRRAKGSVAPWDWSARLTSPRFAPARSAAGCRAGAAPSVPPGAGNPSSPSRTGLPPCRPRPGPSP